MLELVNYLFSQFLDKKDFDITVENENIIVLINKKEISKVIGKSGKIIKAIRVIMSSKNFKDKSNYVLKLEERD